MPLRAVEIVGKALTKEDVRAAQQYAAELARETVIPFMPDAA